MIKGSKMSKKSCELISSAVEGKKNPNYRNGNRIVGNYPCPSCGKSMLREGRRKNIICIDCYNKKRKKNAKGHKKIYKEYYERNKEEIIPKQIEYYHNNKESIKPKRKEYCKNNRENLNKKVRERVKSDPNFAIKLRLRSLFGKAFYNYINGKKSKTSRKYGVNYNKIIEHLKPFPENLSNYHIDHIKPLSKFKFINEDGSINLEEIKKAFAPKNHQWLLAEENLKKGNYYQELIFKKII